MKQQPRFYCYPSGQIELDGKVLPTLPDCSDLPLGVKCTNNGREFTVWGENIRLFGEGYDIQARDLFKLIIAHVERLDRKVASHSRSLTSLNNKKPHMRK